MHINDDDLDLHLFEIEMIQSGAYIINSTYSDVSGSFSVGIDNSVSFEDGLEIEQNLNDVTVEMGNININAFEDDEADEGDENE